MKERFDFETKFRANSDIMDKINHINTIIDEYDAKGIYKLTVRQLFYQLVSRDLYPNTVRTYRLTGDAATKGRDWGLIDWDAIEDRSRSLLKLSTWSSPEACVASASRNYHEDYWNDQQYQPEVWIEKEALVGIIEDTCDEFRIPIFPAHGYSSTTSAYEAGKRFKRYLAMGKDPIVLYLGDHDPSGIHMKQDIEERLEFYARARIEVRRIALNMDQVEEHEPPPNQIKEGDTRSPDYVAEFGTEECWELDALDPDVLIELVSEAAQELIDDDDWEASKKHEARNKKKLEAMARPKAKARSSSKKPKPRK